MTRWLPMLWLAGCLGLAGCSKKEEAPPPHPAEALPAPAEAPAQPTRPPPGTLPREGEAAANPPVHTVVDAGAPGTGTQQQDAGPTGTQQQAAGPSGTGTPAAAGVPAEDPKNREWTARNVELKRALPGQATLRSVRAGQHADFDRVVFEFEGPQLPGYHLSYIDKPVIKCGSGDPTPVDGQGWLEVRFTPARAHDDQGQLTVDTLELKPRLPVILEVERTCDFEGEVTWVLGNKSPNKFRVMELKDPTRLVVDVQR
jgi:hypothetical protein